MIDKFLRQKENYKFPNPRRMLISSVLDLQIHLTSILDNHSDLVRSPCLLRTTWIDDINSHFASIFSSVEF